MLFREFMYLSSNIIVYTQDIYLLHNCALPDVLPCINKDNDDDDDDDGVCARGL